MPVRVPFFHVTRYPSHVPLSVSPRNCLMRLSHSLTVSCNAAIWAAASERCNRYFRSIVRSAVVSGSARL